jgi:hypothetical protein
MSGIAPKQNAFKFKIAPHKQKSIVKKILEWRWIYETNTYLFLDIDKTLIKQFTQYTN